MWREGRRMGGAGSAMVMRTVLEGPAWLSQT